MNDKKLEILRDEINNVDYKIVNLLMSRFSIVNKIGILKKQNEAPIKDRAREKIVLDNISSWCENKTLVPILQQIYKEIMRSSCLYESDKK